QYPRQPHAADERERQRQHDDQTFGYTAEIEVQQQEDDRERHRHDEAQLPRGALHRLELSRPLEAIAGWQREPLPEQLLGVADVTPHVAAEDINVDDVLDLRILG